MALLFDIGVPGGGAGMAVLGLGTFFIILAAAFVVFRLLKKSLKMAVRIVVFFVIVVIAFVGCSSLLYLGVGNSGRGPVQRPSPSPSRQR